MRIPVLAFLWLLSCLLPSTLLAQKAEKIERLKSELNRVSTDTARIRILLTLSMTYEGYQMDSAMAYALKTLNLSEKINDTTSKADALLHIGRLKRDLSQEVEALDNMFEALKLYRQIGDSVQIANSLNDISIIYANSGDFKNSLNYFKQALEIFQQTGDEKGESYALNNIGIIYQEMDDEASAKDYFIQSLKIKIKNKDLYGISRGYTNLGSIAENNEAWAEAMRYYQKADSIYVLTNDKQVQGENFLAMARVRQNQGKAAEARRLALLGFEVAKDINELSIMMKCSKFVSELDEKAKDYKSSLKYQKIYSTMADSLSDKNLDAIREEMKAKFDVEEKEREIVMLKKDNELHEAQKKNNRLINYALSGGMVFFLLISGLIYYAYRTTKAARDEIEQQKNDLDKLNKEKDRFFSILSHDLRSPLNQLKGLSYLLVHHGDVLTAEESKDAKKKIDTSLDNMTTLINNILEWSMATSKKKQWSFEKVNPKDLVDKNIALYQSIAGSKGVTLVHQPGDEVFGYADHQAIDTVIRNLLSNSIKFSHPNSEVTLKTATEGDQIVVSVHDTGIGIPPELQEKLFTMNRSVQQAGTANEKGTGIGLLLCKELMKENNGDISVKSTPGKGSEFFVSIPRFVDDVLHQ